MKQSIALLTAAIVMVSLPASAKDKKNSDISLIYLELNELCRGEPGDAPSTNKICEIRENVARIMKNKRCQ